MMQQPRFDTGVMKDMIAFGHGRKRDKFFVLKWLHANRTGLPFFFFFCYWFVVKCHFGGLVGRGQLNGGGRSGWSRYTIVALDDLTNSTMCFDTLSMHSRRVKRDDDSCEN